MIVNMSAGLGVIGRPQMPIYSASKHAVRGLTKSVRQNMPNLESE